MFHLCLVRTQVLIATMSSSGEEAQSPELGASSSKALVTPVGSPDHSGEDVEQEEVESEVESELESEEEEQTKKKRTRVKDTRDWNLIGKWLFADHEPEEIDGLLFTECKKLMEATGLFRLSTCKAKSSDIFLWKYCTKWDVGKGALKYTLYHCPMEYRFGCNCEPKVGRSEDFVTLEMRGTHDLSSHAPDQDNSKFLKVAQINAIRQGVRMAPKQSAKHLRRNLEQCSPNARIEPKLILSVRRKVRKFRAELTSELLDGLKMDDSFGALTQFVQQRWFASLLEKHNDEESDYHFDLFDVVVIGQDLSPEDDIVYMNTTSLWFLLNWLRNIAAGWLT